MTNNFIQDCWKNLERNNSIPTKLNNVLILDFNEVKKNRLANNLKENPKNLIGRVRRSLVYDKETLILKEMVKARGENSQPKLISIAIQFAIYKVLSKSPILSRKYVSAQDTNALEENSFMLVKN